MASLWMFWVQSLNQEFLLFWSMTHLKMDPEELKETTPASKTCRWSNHPEQEKAMEFFTLNFGL
jgi:hypothetical protein